MPPLCGGIKEGMMRRLPAPASKGLQRWCEQGCDRNIEYKERI